MHSVPAGYCREALRASSGRWSVRRVAGGACSGIFDRRLGVVTAIGCGRWSVQRVGVPGGGACRASGRARLSAAWQKAERASRGHMEGGACRPVGATRRNWPGDSEAGAAYPFPPLILLESGHLGAWHIGPRCASAEMAWPQGGHWSWLPSPSVRLRLTAPHLLEEVSGGERTGLRPRSYGESSAFARRDEQADPARACRRALVGRKYRSAGRSEAVGAALATAATSGSRCRSAHSETPLWRRAPSPWCDTY